MEGGSSSAGTLLFSDAQLHRWRGAAQLGGSVKSTGHEGWEAQHGGIQGCHISAKHRCGCHVSAAHRATDPKSASTPAPRLPMMTASAPRSAALEQMASAMPAAERCTLRRSSSSSCSMPGRRRRDQTSSQCRPEGGIYAAACNAGQLSPSPLSGSGRHPNQPPCFQPASRSLPPKPQQRAPLNCSSGT